MPKNHINLSLILLFFNAIHNGVFKVGFRMEFQYIASYLYYGIEETIEKYRTLIKSNYNDIK